MPPRPTVHVEESLTYYWDAVGLVWVAGTQPGGGSGGGGDASAANQVTGNASLSAINAKLPALSGGRIPVELPAGGGGLTDTELRATAVPVSGAFFQALQPVSGTVTANAGTGTLAVSLASLPALVAGSAAIGKLAANSGVDIGDVDVTSLPAITGAVTANAGTNLNTSALATEAGNLASIKAKTDNLDVLLSTRLKPADTLAAVTNLAQMGGVAISLNTGVRDAGTQRVSIATNDVVPVTDNAGSLTVDAPVGTPAFVRLSDGTAAIATLPVSLASLPALVAGAALVGKVGIDQTTPGTTNAVAVATVPTLTKGTQGATGFTTQDLHNAGRNQTNLFMAAGIAGTNTDTLQSLTGYKGGAAVAATTTPAVVTAGKTYRIKTIIISYQSLATAGAASIRLRANTGGLVAITSPLVAQWTIGSEAAVAGVTTTEAIPVPDGMEFAAGTGIGVSVLGLSTVGAALAAGFVTVTIEGFEY